MESTAHTFGASIATSDGRILSNNKSVYKPKAGKGIHPRESAQHHCETAHQIIKDTLKAANLHLENIDAVAFSQGPGLGPCLRTGATVARALAAYREVPLIPVHHAIAHIEIAAVKTETKDPLVLLVSGGHTCITAFAGKRWRIFGETEDITLGNLFDMFGRKANLSSPIGPIIEENAKRGERYIELPYLVKGNDISYSGLLTSATRKLGENNRFEDLCYSLQEAAFSMLTEATERALAFTEKKELLLTGGVAANKRLQNMLAYISKEHDARFCVVPEEYSGDCGAQIAWTGILAYRAGLKIDIQKSYVKPRWRLDKTPILWR
ncbi:MAG: KEOPS complex N(6)-L-threonylcarbamoyladenine synthase Kae1 [Candidatus Bathyarchaeota archaeon]